MKKIVLGIMAITLTISTIAQTGVSSTGKQKSEKREGKHDRYKHGKTYENLNLTDAQKAQVKTVNDDFKKRMQDLHNQGNITVDEQKQKRQALMKEHKQKVEAILTPEQLKQAETLSEDFQKKEGRRGGNFAGITKDLNLTPEQSVKMSSLNTTFKNKIQDIRQNTALAEDEKKTQLKHLMKQHRSEMEALLTDEQKAQLKNRKKNKDDREAVK